jgi:hypothetical protein
MGAVGDDTAGTITRLSADGSTDLSFGGDGSMTPFEAGLITPRSTSGIEFSFAGRAKGGGTAFMLDLDPRYERLQASASVLDANGKVTAYARPRTLKFRKMWFWHWWADPREQGTLLIEGSVGKTIAVGRAVMR